MSLLIEFQLKLWQKSKKIKNSSKTIFSISIRSFRRSLCRCHWRLWLLLPCERVHWVHWLNWRTTKWRCQRMMACQLCLVHRNDLLRLAYSAKVQTMRNEYRFDGLNHNWLLPCLVDKHRPIDKCRLANRNQLRRSSLASMDPIDRRNSFESDHLSMHSSSSVDDYTIWK